MRSRARAAQAAALAAATAAPPATPLPQLARSQPTPAPQAPAAAQPPAADRPAIKLFRSASFKKQKAPQQQQQQQSADPAADEPLRSPSDSALSSASSGSASPSPPSVVAAADHVTPPEAAQPQASPPKASQTKTPAPADSPHAEPRPAKGTKLGRAGSLKLFRKPSLAIPLFVKPAPAPAKAPEPEPEPKIVVDDNAPRLTLTRSKSVHAAARQPSRDSVATPSSSTFKAPLFSSDDWAALDSIIAKNKSDEDTSVTAAAAKTSEAAASGDDADAESGTAQEQSEDADPDADADAGELHNYEDEDELVFKSSLLGFKITPGQLGALAAAHVTAPALTISASSDFTVANPLFAPASASTMDLAHVAVETAPAPSIRSPFQFIAQLPASAPVHDMPALPAPFAPQASTDIHSRRPSRPMMPFPPKEDLFGPIVSAFDSALLTARRQSASNLGISDRLPEPKPEAKHSPAPKEHAAPPSPQRLPSAQQRDSGYDTLSPMSHAMLDRYLEETSMHVPASAGPSASSSHLPRPASPSPGLYALAHDTRSMPVLANAGQRTPTTPAASTADHDDNFRQQAHQTIPAHQRFFMNRGSSPPSAGFHYPSSPSLQRVTSPPPSHLSASHRQTAPVQQPQPVAPLNPAARHSRRPSAHEVLASAGLSLMRPSSTPPSSVAARPSRLSAGAPSTPEASDQISAWLAELKFAPAPTLSGIRPGSPLPSSPSQIDEPQARARPATPSMLARPKTPVRLDGAADDSSTSVSGAQNAGAASGASLTRKDSTRSSRSGWLGRRPSFFGTMAPESAEAQRRPIR
nr:hypothetical protein HK105_005279 [Polyrhizophydium stewartii]